MNVNCVGQWTRARPWSFGALACAAVACAAPGVARASQAQVHVVEGHADFTDGDFDGASLLPDGVVVAGPSTKALADALPGAVLALARAGDGQLYAATQAPGRVYKIVEGKAPELVLELDKPLVTALLPVGKGTLVALTAPEGGAAIIDLATKKHEDVIAKDVKLLLAGAVLDDVVYAVGGGEEGVLLKLERGKKAFETVATVEEPQLRSVAAAKVGGALRLVVGGGEEGILYEVKGGVVRALLDAEPGEITSVAIGADGSVYAAAVDGEGKLSKGATAKAKDAEDDDDKKSKKKPKPRKVKSAEIWRVDSSGRATILFQSKDHGAYALALLGDELFAGTGPRGRVLRIDAKGGKPVGVLVRAKAHDEVTSLLVDARVPAIPGKKAGLVLGTAHGPAVLVTTPASTSAYTSGPLDADAIARYGRASSTGKGGARLSVRTGNTKEPDATWSAWAADSTAAPRAQYAQVKAELNGGAALAGLSLSYLIENRAPHVDRVEVLAPGWKVISNPREPPETRSVTFNEKPFAKFLDRRGGQNPTLDERPYGKQSFDIGWRTIYAYVEDADKDAIRYRFSLGKVGVDGNVGAWSVWKDWSEEPFLSLEASRLADGQYRVKVDVDDSLTSGPARMLTDSATSAAFAVSHELPRVQNARATATAQGARIALDVSASLPLTVVRCSLGGDEWVPLDPKDGLTDGTSESFDVELKGSSKMKAVSCEVYDEALNFARVDLPLGR